MNDSEHIVYLVDDEPAVLKAVSRVLRSAGFRVAAYESPRRFLQEHDPSRHGCAVLDMAMPGIDGLELQRSLTGAESGVSRPIVFLTGRADVPQSVKAMKRGAVDFLTKPVDDAALIAAVRSALALDLRMRREHDDTEHLERRLATLTPREREVMDHVVAGRLNKQIAAELGTTEGTIKVHRARVMQKLGASSLAELVRMAERIEAASASPRTHYTKVQ